MKKMFLFFILLLITSFFLYSCNDLPDDPSDPINPGDNESSEIKYFNEFHLNKDRELLVFNRSESLSFAEKVTASAIQGIYARNGVRFYFWENNSYNTWLKDLETNYGITARDVTFEEMCKMYLSDYNNGYLLYDYETKRETVNVASTICGVTEHLPVDVTIEEKLKEYGFELKQDVRTMSQKKCFNEYSDYLNNSGLVQETPSAAHMRDYGIACKYFIFYDDGTTTSTYMFRGTVHAWCKPNSPIFGWGPGSEDEHVAISSQNGQFTLASDWALNMTVFSCKELNLQDKYVQKYKTTDIVAEQGKHYVTIQMSDGDNVQCWYNSFPFSTKYFACERQLDFPMGYSMQPSLYDLGPNILKYMYDNAKAKDYFVCAVSGQGYIYPQTYKQGELENYLKGLSQYLRKTDLSVVQILDSGFSQAVVDAYAKVPEINGGIYCFGEKYAGGHGSVYWSNDKPFVSVRETLWNADAKAMAKRINSYPKDPTKITGYTVVNLHPWSMEYKDVVELVSLLDENVVVVTADDFIRLITDNVPHKNSILV